MVTPTELQFMLRNLGIEMSDELIDGLMKEASKTGEFLVCFDAYAETRVLCIINGRFFFVWGFKKQTSSVTFRFASFDGLLSTNNIQNSAQINYRTSIKTKVQG